jgi:hypothetical protein
MAVWLLPAASVGSSKSGRKITNHKISETRKFARIGTEGVAGLVDGRIGATSVHGAFRDVGQFTSSSSEVDRGTEFDARGSRSFVQHLTVAINDGQVTVSGTGKWTGGTGSYRAARGSFKLSGRWPIGSLQTSHLKGSISY